MSVLEIEAMLSIRLYQQLFFFIVLFDYDTMITKYFLVIILDIVIATF